MSSIGVLGAGTWGMALARMLSNSGHDVTVWSALPREIDEYSATRRHPNLPGMVIPDAIIFTKSIEEVCRDKEIVLFAVPSVFVRSTAAAARPYIPGGQVIVDVAKGIEADTLMTMSEVIRSELDKDTGTGRAPCDVKIVALEPEDSPVLSEGRAGAHKIQGIGAGFVPDVLNTKVYDEVYKATGDESFAAAKLLARKEGISVGISSGAALSGAIALAKRPENKGKVIVALLPDSGDRYYSTALFTE
jgi:hypothetical protein